MDKRINVKPMIDAITKMCATPERKFGGSGWAKVVSPLPNIRIKTNDGVEIPSSLIEVSPFCMEWKSKVLKHKHTYTDKNDGKDSTGDRPKEETDPKPETSEELLEIQMWRGLQTGDDVCYIRTNDSQKYLLMWRKEL